MKAFRSAELFAEAKELILGGVNSPVRAFQGVTGIPASSIMQRGPSSTTWTEIALWIISVHFFMILRIVAGQGTRVAPK